MSKRTVNAYAAMQAGAELQPFSYELPEIGADQVDIKVEYCGICHSDLSVRDNDWGISQYPFVPGHEIIGTVVNIGESAQGVKMGDRVGLGWFCHSCMHCDQCMSGKHNLCADKAATIVGHHGGFADYVRAHWAWAIPLPAALDPATAGPLLCGGITVFQPILQADVKPTDRVGVIGIGGLGHLALQFLHKWGCEVTAFSSSSAKTEQAKAMGAHQVVNSRDDQAMQAIAGSLDFILNTTNVNLNWQAYLDALAPQGTLHTVGAVPDPIPAPAFSMISNELTISGSPLGSPALTRSMLRFCERHAIQPVTEMFDLKDANQALEHLASGKARYRVVLKVR